MKILYFHQHFSTPKGSTGTRSYEMARKLITQKHNVTMVCGSNGLAQTGLTEPFIGGKRTGTVNGINVIEFNLDYSNSDGFLKRTITFLKFSFRSIGVVFTEQYDVVFATTTPLTAGIPGIFARFFKRKPFVFEVRDLWPKLPKAMGVIKNPLVLKLMSALEWLSYHSATRLVGLAPGIVEGIKHRGIDDNKIIFVPNGCDLELFNSEHAKYWQAEYIDDNDFIALFSGTHGIANGLDAVLDVASVLKARGNRKIKFLLVGCGKLKPKLQARAEKEKLDNIIFHAPVDKEELSGIMSRANIGLQILANIPAFYEGTSPNKFFDYIAAGLPVLNNYPGWIAKEIKTSKCGYVVPAEQPELFANVLEEAANSSEELKLMSINARKLAERQFDRTVLSDNWTKWVCGAIQ